MCYLEDSLETGQGSQDTQRRRSGKASEAQLEGIIMITVTRGSLGTNKTLITRSSLASYSFQKLSSSREQVLVILQGLIPRDIKS